MVVAGAASPRGVLWAGKRQLLAVERGNPQTAALRTTFRRLLLAKTSTRLDFPKYHLLGAILGDLDGSNSERGNSVNKNQSAGAWNW